jgi:hypothetical protein
MQEQRVKSAAVITDLKPRPPAENVTMDRMAIKSGSVKQMRSPITSTSYTVATLQSATNSFSQEFIIGEGSLGRVYRAEFPNGKVIFECCICFPPSYYWFENLYTLKYSNSSEFFFYLGNGR